MPDVYITIPKPIVEERNGFTATSYYRDGDAGSAPTTARYRIDCLTTNTTLVDWTSLTPGESIAIAVASGTNRIISNSNRFEKKQLTVAADHGTSTETRDVVNWKVRNTRAFKD